MYATITSVYPALDKESAVVELLREWAQLRQARGVRVDLVQPWFSPSEVVVDHIYDDLAALEAQRRADQADADFQARLARLAPLLRAPVASRLFESLVDGAPTGSAPVTFRFLGNVYPALGQEARARAVLEEFVRGRQAEGRTRRSLWQQLFTPAGTTFVVAESFLDLAEVERVARESTPVSQKFDAAIGGLSRVPGPAELYEILVRFPS